MPCYHPKAKTFGSPARNLIDFWSSLEHQLNYKNGGVENSDAIRAELRRCADDVAATDLSMQTLLDVIDSAEREAECA